MTFNNSLSRGQPILSADQLAHVVAVVDQPGVGGAGLPETGVDGGAERLLKPLPRRALGRLAVERRVGEFVQAIDITAPDDPMDFRCYKISKRFDQDISAVMAAINIRLRGEKIAEARIAFGGMSATPKRAKAAEAQLKGKPFGEEAFKAAMTAMEQDFAPIDDHRASAAYRMKAAKNLLLKYFVERRFGDARITGRGKVLTGMAAE